MQAIYAAERLLVGAQGAAQIGDETRGVDGAQAGNREPAARAEVVPRRVDLGYSSQRRSKAGQDQSFFSSSETEARTNAPRRSGGRGPNASKIAHIVRPGP